MRRESQLQLRPRPAVHRGICLTLLTETQPRDFGGRTELSGVEAAVKRAASPVLEPPRDQLGADSRPWISTG